MTNLITNLTITTAPSGGTPVPDADGIVMGNNADIGFHVYATGGVGENLTNRTITIQFQGSDDVEISATRRWVNLGIGLDLTTVDETSSWCSVGTTALEALIDFENFKHKRIRLVYSLDAAPGPATPGSIVVNYYKKG